MPENPRFNLSGPEVAPFLPLRTTEPPPPPSGPSRAPLPAPLTQGRRSAANASEANASQAHAATGYAATGTDGPAAPLPAGGTSRLLWLLAGVATGGLCFGAGIAVERRRLLTRSPRPASSTGTAPFWTFPSTTNHDLDMFKHVSTRVQVGTTA